MQSLALLVSLLAAASPTASAKAGASVPAGSPAAAAPVAVTTPATMGTPLEFPPWELMKHDFREADVVAQVRIASIDTARVVWTDSTSVAARQIGFIVFHVSASVAEVFEDRHGQVEHRAHDIVYFSSIEAGSSWRQDMLAARDRIVFLEHQPHAPAATFDEVTNSGGPATPDVIEKLRILRKTPPENSGAGHTASHAAGH